MAHRTAIIASTAALVALTAAAVLAAVGMLGADGPVPVGKTLIRHQEGPCFLDGIDWSEPERMRLPGRLAEVSGLALLDSVHLLAHDDERGIVAIIDSRSGERVGQFTLGPRLPRDDFEGIAILGDRLYLATSGDRLYESPLGADGQTVAFRVHDTGLGELCELEGLAADSATGSLLLSCKNPRARDLRGQVVVYAWSPARAELEGERFRVPVAAVAVEEGKPFRPSAVELLPGGDLLIISGADRAIAVVAPPDTVRCALRLDSRHRQAEGLALLPDGSIAIADEGNPARLTIYHPRVR